LTCDENCYDDQLDLNEETLTLEKVKAAKTNEEFPDEVDTPMNTPARVRFQK
jgi:pre-rRNA-processing protein TSR1